MADGAATPAGLPCDEAGSERDARDQATAAVFAGAVAVVMSLYSYTGTFGYSDRAGRDALGGLSIALFLVFSGHGWRALAPATVLRKAPQWAHSQGALSLAALAILCLAGLATPFLGTSPLPLFGLVGIASALSAVRTAFRWPLRPILPLGLVVALTLFIAARMCWFILLLLDMSLVYTAVHRDTVYHSALAAMIQTYGIPSTGVDGVVYFPYHFGSHWVAAQLANLTGNSLFAFYQTTFRSVEIPFFLHALAGFVVALRQAVYPVENRSAPLLRADPGFWLLLYLGVVGVHRGFDALILADHHSSVLGSESFVLAHACAYAAFGMIVAFFRGRLMRRPREDESSPRTGRLVTSDAAFLCLVLPLTFAAIGFIKISLLAVALPVAVYAFVRYRLYRLPACCVSLAITAVLALVVVRTTSMWTSNPTELTTQMLKEFPARYLAEPWQMSASLAAHAFWPLLFAVSRLWQLRVETVSALFAAVRERRVIDLELMAVICAAGFGPITIARVEGAGHIYFAIVPIVAGAALFLACRGIVFQGLHKMAAGARNPRLAWLLALLAAGPFLVRVGDDAYNPNGADPVVVHSLIRTAYVAPWQCLFRDCITKRKETALRWRTGRPAAYRVLGRLERLNRLPRGEKRRALLFIPKTTRAYWELNPVYHGSLPCLVRPFIAPAIAGVAMLDGRPEGDCRGVHETAYNINGPPPVASTDSATVCRAAELRGFSNVFVLDQERQSVRLRRLSCGTS